MDDQGHNCNYTANIVAKYFEKPSQVWTTNGIMKYPSSSSLYQSSFYISMSLPVRRREYPGFESPICSRWRKWDNATNLRGKFWMIVFYTLSYNGNGICKSQPKHLAQCKHDDAVTRRICKYAGFVDFDLNQFSDLLGCLCNLEQRWLRQVQEVHHGKQEESVEL
ncbi:hypothetical protein H5410_057878 [Solanum commersonii]|uniref:Uncharacterized protein n=1 Tax=Solanum commersonii TaxID=4109 RepID=A0A9J5WRW6_SOLCO|nr:hypothetical protein H5410_057878 [Solanum commersonii]